MLVPNSVFMNPTYTLRCSCPFLKGFKPKTSLTKFFKYIYHFIFPDLQTINRKSSQSNQKSENCNHSLFNVLKVEYLGKYQSQIKKCLKEFQGQINAQQSMPCSKRYRFNGSIILGLLGQYILSFFVAFINSEALSVRLNQLFINSKAEICYIDQEDCFPFNEAPQIVCL